MRCFNISLAAMLVAVAALLAALPAEALTANQYDHQGHGRYTNSSGTRVMRPTMRHHRYHRHIRSHRHRG